MNSLMGRFLVASDPVSAVLKSGTPRLTFTITEVNDEHPGVELIAVAQFAVADRLASVRVADELLIVGSLRKGHYLGDPMQLFISRADLLWSASAAGVLS
jgi:predicted trehalose synthase